MTITAWRDLLILAALWGASFMFMRLGAPEFGPVALIFLRVSIAGLVLIPVLWWWLGSNGLRQWRQHWPQILMAGLIGSALPFLLIAFGTLSLSSGYAAIINAFTPIWSAVVMWIWLQDRLTLWQGLGMVIALFGVVLLSWQDVAGDFWGAGLAALACFTATFLYGVFTGYTKRYLSEVQPMVMATGSQTSAGLLLLLPAIYWWPAQAVSGSAWTGAVLLGAASTAVAYVLFFRLLNQIGATKTVSVTFLIPVFAAFWGYVILNESMTMMQGLAAVVILLGTALVLQVFHRPNMLHLNKD